MTTIGMWAITRLSVFGVRLAVVLLAAYWILLFTGTHLPKVPSTGIPHFDKVQHLIAFAGLAFLLAWAVPASRKNVATKMTVAFLVAVSYGIVDEWSQAWVNRTTDLHDYYADCCGALLGIVLYFLLRRMIVDTRRPDRTVASGPPLSRRDTVASETGNAA